MASATATKPLKGFQVVCPFCGDQEAPLNLDVNALGRVTCGACDTEFSPREAAGKVAEQLRRWEGLARWCEAAGSFLAGPEAE